MTKPVNQDALRIAKILKSEDVRMHYTTPEDYFHSPLVEDNQKVLVALLMLSKRFKSLTVSNSFIAEYLNRIGIEEREYYTEDQFDQYGELVALKGDVKSSQIVHFRTFKDKDGNLCKEPLYTPSGVSNAIQMWQKEGVLTCSYEYSYNKNQDKNYKFYCKRTIRLNLDQLRVLLSCFSTESKLYQSLARRSRKRKFIRKRPISILDDIQQILAEMSAKAKAKYQSAKGLFMAFCWSVSRKSFNVKLDHQPKATINETDAYLKRKQLDLDNSVNDIVHEEKRPKTQGNPIIKAAFDMMASS